MPATVSVIIPAFRVQAFLAQTVESVMGQTHPVHELIVVDDGSPDGTLAVAQELAQKHPRIRVLQQSNQGVSAARNHGMSAATGEYIAFLDSDDVWHRDFLRAGVDALSAGADVFVAKAQRFYHVPGDSEELFGPSGEFIDHFPVSLVRGNAIVPAMVLCRREIIEKVGVFDDGSRVMEDWDYWLRMVQVNTRFSFSRFGVLVFYRYAPESRSSFASACCQRCAATLEKHQDTGVAPKRVFRQYRSMWLRRRGSQDANGREARRFFLQSLVLMPWSLKTWGKWLLSWFSLHRQS